MRFLVPLAGLDPATCCLGDNCPYSAPYAPVGSRQLRLGRDSAQYGLVGCNRAWWNDRQNDHLSKQTVDLRDAPGHLTTAVRRAVFDNDEVPADLAPFVDTVVRCAYRVPTATLLPWSAPATARTRSSRRSSSPPPKRPIGSSRLPVAPWPRRDMRLRILDRGHDLPTRLTFAVVRRMARARCPR
jgi:hypothetical protein